VLYRTAEEAGVKRPCKINLPRTSKVDEFGRVQRLKPDEQITTFLKMTQKQKELQQRTVDLANTGSYKNKAAIYQALDMGQKNAFSPFLIEGQPTSAADFVENSPKVQYIIECIRTVKKFFEDRGESISGQIFYANRGHKFFPLIKEYLETQLGFERNVDVDGSLMDEVAIFTGDTSDDERERIISGFLSNKIKVLLGSSAIREGIDLQTNATDIYNSTVDWNRSDLHQLEGRIWRPGNSFANVRITIPLLEDSFDAFLMQKLDIKTALTNDLWYKADRGNVLEMDSLDPEEIKFALITDLDVLTQETIKAELQEANMQHGFVETTLKTLKAYHQTKQIHNSYRSRALDEISEFHTLMLELDYIESPLSEGELKTLPSERQIVIKRNTKLFNQIESLINRVPLDDKTLLQVGKLILPYRQTENDEHKEFRATFQWYANYTAEMKKAERTMLVNKGFSTDQIPEAIKVYEKDLALIHAELKMLESDEHKEKILKEVTEKKANYSIVSKPLMEVVQDFASTNQLIGVKASENDSANRVAPEVSSTDNKLLEMELELEALAVSVSLELLNSKYAA